MNVLPLVAVLALLLSVASAKSASTAAVGTWRLVPQNDDDDDDEHPIPALPVVLSCVQDGAEAKCRYGLEGLVAAPHKETAAVAAGELRFAANKPGSAKLSGTIAGLPASHCFLLWTPDAARVRTYAKVRDGHPFVAQAYTVERCDDAEAAAVIGAAELVKSAAEAPASEGSRWNVTAGIVLLFVVLKTATLALARRASPVKAVK